MIETARLRLRPHTLEDFDPWYAMFSDRELFRFIAAPQLSREDGWNRLLRYAGHWSLLGYGMFAVFDRASGAFIGDVGFADFHRGLGERFDAVPEASWILTRAAQGRGLAAEAVAACHDWIDRAHAPARTVCLINPDNAASLRIAGKFGYRPFGNCLYKDAPCAMLERLSPRRKRQGAIEDGKPATMRIEACTADMLDDWVALRLALWPEGGAQDHRDEAAGILESENETAFIARDDNGLAIGLAEAALRHDYVNGCDTSPVGFLEGIYVQPENRKRGVARALCRAVETWAAGHGCAEFASDAGLLNTGSQQMHEALGFEETERVVYYRKRLQPG